MLSTEKSSRNDPSNDDYVMIKHDKATMISVGRVETTPDVQTNTQKERTYWGRNEMKRREYERPGSRRRK